MASGQWPDLPTAVLDCRRFVNDTPVDRFVKEKIVVGPADGTNTNFFAWDTRFVGSTLVVTLDFVPVPFASVTQTLGFSGATTPFDLGLNITGQFTLATPPAPTTTVRAGYFWVYFLDTEITESLQNAANEINEQDDPTILPAGIKLAALNFAGSFLYSRLSIRWAQKMSNQFLMIEEPQDRENMQRPNMFMQISKQMWDQGVKLRDGFYMRHGRRNAPAFNRFYPRIPNLAPRP